MPRQPNGDGKPPPPRPYSGPNYAGFVFVLASGIGKPNHILAISTQENQNIDYLANITGLWHPKGDDSNAKPITGYIAGNGDVINCNWITSKTSGAYNVLQGTLTYNVGKKSGTTAGVIGPSAYLDGDVTAHDANGDVIPGMGPGPVSGTGQKQPLAAP
jgi:hypothetical protein